MVAIRKRGVGSNTLPGGRRGRRGSVTLELVLTLPVYLLILFSIMTLGDLGLTASQSHIGSRITAWRVRDGYDIEKLAGGNLRRVVLKLDDTISLPVIEVSGKKGTRAATSWKGFDVPAAFSFEHHKLKAPFEAGGEGLVDAVLDNLGIGLPVPPSILNPLPNLNIPGQPSFNLPSITILGEMLYGKNLILSNAMLGDLTRSSGSNMDSDIPWMRRRYGVISLTHSGAAGLVSPNAFKAHHTVLIGDGYRSCKPGAYKGTGLFGDLGDLVADVQGRSLDLRATAAFGADGETLTSSVGFFVGHQQETLRMILEYCPAYPLTFTGFF